MKWWRKLVRGMLYALPAAMFLSYYPVITVGSDTAMNLELSVPLILLVLLDLVLVVGVVAFRKIRKVLRWWFLLLFPIFASLSILWSDNVLRGVLTAGIIWAIVLAVMGVLALKEEIFDAKYQRRWMRVFIWTSVAACVWCIAQCVMDVMGVGREVSLMCRGCTSASFGFPHPNGFAIEPQFMGNLLLAPAIVLMCRVCGGGNDIRLSERVSAILVVFTLFLTFSRGAIYAFVVGLAVMSVLMLVRGWRSSRKQSLRSVLAMWGVMIVAFVASLTTQGVMAELGPTNDTFGSGVAKVLNHLTLGVVDIRSKVEGENIGAASDGGVADEAELLANTSGETARTEAAFDGYVAESTEVRVKLTDDALAVWRGDFRTAVVGVGLGGAGVALYNAGRTATPKEIVQNEYASTLLETGAVGVLLAAATVCVVVYIIWRRGGGYRREVILGLLAAYGVSLFFFSGLPNALQVYLMPVLIWVCLVV